MLTNADITIWSKDTYTRHNVNDVYWNDSRGQTVTRNGIQVQDSILVYIYDDSYIPQAGDIIVHGTSGFDFNTATEQATAADMKTFRTQYPDFAVVKNVNPCLYGGLPHIELTAR